MMKLCPNHGLSAEFLHRVSQCKRRMHEWSGSRISPYVLVPGLPLSLRIYARLSERRASRLADYLATHLQSRLQGLEM